jgi:hypothetical protein
VEIAIQSLELLEGRLPPRALGLTIEWAGQHQDELMMDWRLAATHQRSPGSTLTDGSVVDRDLGDLLDGRGVFEQITNETPRSSRSSSTAGRSPGRATWTSLQRP